MNAIDTDREWVEHNDRTERAAKQGFGRSISMPAVLLTYCFGAVRTRENRFRVAGEIVAGQSLGLDLYISDGWLSKRHLRVESDGETSVIEDLESLNRTFVDGRRKVANRTDLGTSVFIFAISLTSLL